MLLSKDLELSFTFFLNTLHAALDDSRRSGDFGDICNLSNDRYGVLEKLKRSK